MPNHNHELPGFSLEFIDTPRRRPKTLVFVAPILPITAGVQA